MINVLDLTPADVAGICDHTFLQRPECYRGRAVDPPGTYRADFRQFIAQTVGLKPMPYAVCVRHEEVARTRELLDASGCENVIIAAVVGFPLGDRVPVPMKLDEIRHSLDSGAAEIDSVLRWQALREGKLDIVKADLDAVIDAAHRRNALVKVILEVSELNLDQIAKACELCTQAGADFVKTSTGFARAGATVETVAAMRRSFAGGIKLAGGVKKKNLGELLAAAIGEQVEKLDPLKIRIGESGLLG